MGWNVFTHYVGILYTDNILKRINLIEKKKKG